ncbi:MAG: transposase [Chloroflexota bacterium]
MPSAVRTYAPSGQTPILKYPLWERLSVISAITPEGKLYSWSQDKAFNGTTIVRFLKHLLHHISGKLLLIWDGLPAHRSQAVKDFLSQGAAKRLHLAQLPAYAPDLNPDEGVWNYLKNVELKNLCCHDLSELRLELSKAIARLRHKSHLILGFIRQARLPGLL